MPDRSPMDRLEQAVQAVLARGSRGVLAAGVDPEVAPLVEIAEALRDLPNPRFRARLRSELERMAAMPTPTETVPAVRQTAMPRLRIRNAGAAIEFYTKAFGARELMRFVAHGEVAHAEMEIGNSMFTLGEEAPEYGFPGPETLGGSPVGIQLYVPDVDAFVERAVAAGARLVNPVTDQFYGDRVGSVADPFGYTWSIATRKHEHSVEEMHRQFAALEAERQASRTAPTFIPKDFHTVTPYLVAQDAPALIDFVKQAFGAEERFRATGTAGGMHAEVRIGDSMVMIGGGAPDLSWRGQLWPTALHVYVEDVDAVFERALQAGATSIGQPVDQAYGERGGGVKDPHGNVWYIATAKGAHYIPEGLHAVNVYLHPLRAEPVIAFMKRAFDAAKIEKYASPDGVIHHAKVTIGDSAVEMGEANGPYQPMPTTFYLYVPDVDASYSRALQAGASSIAPPTDQPYGDRNAHVADAFGNQWYIATQLKETRQNAER
jgi:PhnB protein